MATEQKTTAVPPSAVGRDKARYLAARFLLPPVVTVHAAFTAHGGRLSGEVPCMPSSRHWRGCPRLDLREGRTMRYHSRCDPSPCTRLSRAPTTRATLTADTDRGGLQAGFPHPSLALLHLPCRLSHVPIDGLHGIVSVVVTGPTSPRVSRLPSGRGVEQVHPRPPMAAHAREAASER